MFSLRRALLIRLLDGNQALTEANLQALNLINGRYTGIYVKKWCFDVLESLESIGLDRIDPLFSLIAKPNPPDANALEFTEDDMVDYDDSLLDFGSVWSLYCTPPSKQISPWESESNSGSGSCDMGRRASSRSEEEQPNATNQVIEDAKLVWELAKGFVRAMPL